MNRISALMRREDSPSSAQSHKGQHRRQRDTRVIAALIVVLGMLVMLYPVVSTAWNNRNTAKAAQEYAKLEKNVPQEVKNQLWDQAHAYNESKNTGPILDPWLNQIDADNAEYAEYLRQLNAVDAMARLVIPAIDVDLPVYHGTTDDVLQRGLGHLYGSDLPVGGESTHSVITGHTGLSNATMFDNLAKLKLGEAIYVQVAGHKLKYVVDQREVVLPHETELLRPEAGADYLTLITCTPYGINTHRLLVRAHQVPLDEEEAKILEKSHAGGWQWWMYALLAASIAVGVVLAWWLWRQTPKGQNEQDEQDEQNND